MSRKGRNIYQRKDGRWEGRVVLGYGQNGKRRYHSVYGKSYSETKKKMQEYMKKHSGFTGDGKTIGYILYLWLEHKKKGCKASTYANYRKIVENHLLPFWEDSYPEDLNREKARQFILTKKNDGLKNSYIKTIFGLFLQALKYYESEHENVHFRLPALTLIGKKERESEERELPSTEIMQEIEKTVYADDAPEQAGILIAINSGIRIGELCALQWKDVDLDRGILHVSKTMQRIKTYTEESAETEIRIMRPKSDSSVREIPLPGRLTEFLKAKKGAPEAYVVPGKRAVYCEPRTLQYRFERFLEKNGFEVFRFHALRHCFASRCIELGFDAKSLSEIMGHSNIRITLQLYVHTSLKQKRILMERLDSMDV